MEAPYRRSKLRFLWLAVLLVILAGTAGGYVWYEHSATKYNRILNATSV